MKKIACILLAGTLLVSAAFSEVTFSIGFRAYSSIADIHAFRKDQGTDSSGNDIDRYTTDFLKFRDANGMNYPFSIGVKFGNFFASYGNDDPDPRAPTSWFELGTGSMGYNFNFNEYGKLTLALANGKNPSGLADGYAGGSIGLIRPVGVDSNYALSGKLSDAANIKLNEDYVGVCRYAPQGVTKSKLGYRMFRGLDYDYYGNEPYNVYAVYTLPAFSAVPGTFKIYGTVYTSDNDVWNGSMTSNFSTNTGWAGMLEWNVPKKFFIDAQYRWYKEESYAVGLHTGAFIGTKFRFMTGVTFALDGEDKTDYTYTDDEDVVHNIQHDYDDKWVALDLRMRYDFTSKLNTVFSTKITGYQIGLENGYNSNMNDPVTMAEGGLQVNYKFNSVITNLYSYICAFTPDTSTKARKMGKISTQFAVGATIKPVSIVTITPEMNFTYSGVGAGNVDDTDYRDLQAYRVNFPITIAVVLSQTRK